MKRFVFSLFVSWTLCIFSTELEVTVPTHATMLPVEIAPFENKQESLEISYLQKLLHVLFFDFHHNGLTYLIDSATKQRLFVDHLSCRPLSSKKMNAFITLYPKFHKQSLYLHFQKAKDPKHQTIKIELSGELASDRRAIHKAHDQIIKALFGINGIASSHIVFTKKLENKTHPLQYQSEIWIADWDGANARRLTLPFHFQLTPKFVPTPIGQAAAHFLCVSYQTGQSKVHLGQIGTEKTMPIIKLRGNQLLPAISRQKDKIAFIADAAGRPDLFLVHYDIKSKKFSRPYQLFSYPESTTASPCFSPDGNKIAFVCDKTGTPRIYVLDINKKGKQGAYLLTKKNLENTCPSWSSDGKRLAYIAKVDGIRQIWLYDFLTQQEIPLTTDSMNKENPSWAPDNLHILFNNVDKKNTQLYMLHVNQPIPVQITFGTGEKKYPSWEVWVE